VIKGDAFNKNTLNMTTLKPVKPNKEALSAQVASRILELIATREMEPGSRLPTIDQLAVVLRVSQSSVREAIKLLDAWGAVEVKHGVGVFVASSMEKTLSVQFKMTADRSKKALLNLHQIREALEPDIAALAACLHQPEHLQKMETALRTMEQAFDDPEAFIKADLDFHTALAESTNNNLFLIVIHPIIDLMEEGKHLVSRSPGMLTRAQNFHWRTYQAVKDRSAERASEEMRLHLKQSWEEIQTQMKSDEVVELTQAGKGALSDQIVHAILSMITDKKLEEGARLPTIEGLSKQLGVSRTSLREAIKLLDAWGAVTVKHGVGIFVSGPTNNALRVPMRMHTERGERAVIQLHQLREALEPDIAALAAKNATSEQINNIQKAVQEMEWSLDDPDRFILYDLVFHTALAEATGNNLFLIVIHSVVDLLQNARNLAITNPGAGMRAQHYHLAILEHIKAGNSEEAREVMAAHLNQAIEEIQARLVSG
jgi:GntR family transcriptional regulator, transcriptional repressor for pyruvate dehydrogenase complex